MKPMTILASFVFCLSMFTFGCGSKPEIDGKAALDKDQLTITLKSTSAKKGLCVWKAKFKCDGKVLDKIEMRKFDIEPGAEKTDSIKAPCEKPKFSYKWNCAADAYPEANTKDPVFSKK